MWTKACPCQCSAEEEGWLVFNDKERLYLKDLPNTSRNRQGSEEHPPTHTSISDRKPSFVPRWLKLQRSTCRIPSCGPRQVGLVCTDIHTALAAHSRAGPVWDGWGNEAGNLNYNLYPQTDWVCRVLEYFANGKRFWLLGNFLERNFVII